MADLLSLSAYIYLRIVCKQVDIIVSCDAIYVIGVYYKQKRPQIRAWGTPNMPFSFFTPLQFSIYCFQFTSTRFNAVSYDCPFMKSDGISAFYYL